MKETTATKTDLQLLGNINKPCTIMAEGDVSLIDILWAEAGGMSGDKQVEIVQIGGPLGRLAAGEDLKNPLNHYMNDLPCQGAVPTLLYLNNRFCPIDFSKFLLTHVMREMGVRNGTLETLGSLVEEISSGNTRKYTWEELQREISGDSEDCITARVKSNLSWLMKRYEGVFVQHFEDRKCAAGICDRLFTAQCVNACPAGIDIPGYIALMYQGQDEEAYRLMHQKNPLSLICGKICARPCEASCRRGEIEQTVGVRALKHYAATAALKGDLTVEKLPDNGRSVGIIGCGPAGLSAACYLAKTGYAVHIYEKHPVAGGMLAVGVPAYRLAQESIDREVQIIKNMGVVIHLGTEIGKDIAFADLREKHNSILLATGCPVGNTFSGHLENLESAIDFLRSVKLEGRRSVGSKVIVIGGGDVAMDAARTAVRLGAVTVHLVSLERFLQMPANYEEKEEARQEGIIFHNGFGSKIIHEHQQNDRSHATGITFRKCQEIYDLTGRFSPVFKDEDTFDLECDHIILAIGQRSDPAYLDSAAETDERGRILFGSRQETSAEGVYVAGDMSGPGSAIRAIAEGRKAAEEIDSYLGGKGLYTGEEIEVPVVQNHYSIWDTPLNSEKVELFGSERVSGSAQSCRGCFEENRTVLSEETARLEALRCMRCDRNSRQ